MNRLLFILLLAGGSAGLIVGGQHIAEQNRTEHRYVPVSAHIDTCSLSLSPRAPTAGNGSVPNLSYHFDFAGRRYEGMERIPYSTLLDSEKTRNLQREYSPGARVTALVDPVQPQNALLFLDYPLAYCWLFAGSFFPALIGMGGVMGLVRPARRTMLLTAKLDADGFREVLSSKSIAQRGFANLLLLGSALVLAVGMSINLLHVYGSLSGDGIALMICLWTIVLALVVARLRIWHLSSTFTQPRLFIEPFPISRGVPLQIKLALQVKRPLEHLHLRAWLLCTETSVIFLRRQNLAVRKNVVEYVCAEQKQSHLRPGAALAASSRFTISAGTPASGSATVEGFPNYQWSVQLEMTGARKYVDHFPLEIG